MHTLVITQSCSNKHISTPNQEPGFNHHLLPDTRVQPCQEDRRTSLTGGPPPCLHVTLPPFCRPPLKYLRFCETVGLRSVKAGTNIYKESFQKQHITQSCWRTQRTRTFLPGGGLLPFTVIKEMGENTQNAHQCIPQGKSSARFSELKNNVRESIPARTRRTSLAITWVALFRGQYRDTK